MGQVITKIVGEDAGKQAENKSRFGKTNWVVYRDRQGVLTAELMTAASVKNPLLAKGTNGKFKAWFQGKPLLLGWRSGINQYHHLKNPEPGHRLLN